jgi:hypothetical protein
MTMNRKDVESTMIRTIGFDPDTSTLEVVFNNDEVWHYFDFPESLWYEFETADSHGKFFNRMIKKHYAESRVG